LSAAELAEKLKGITAIFQYLNDKETFYTAYTKGMAKRLLRGKSASVPAERLMIEGLEGAGGIEYARKLATMLEDTKASSALNMGFQSSLKEGRRTGVCPGLLFQVLRGWSWPLSIEPNSSDASFTPPDIILNSHKRFEEFYKSRDKPHGNRRLRWVWSLCNGELKANFASSARVPYIFQVSAYQMAVLLLFNSHTTMSYDSIQKSTGLGDRCLCQCLPALLHAGVLTISPPGSIPALGTQLSVNPGFRNQKIKVNLFPKLQDRSAARDQEKIEMQKTQEERQRSLEV
jgi:cullin 1